MQQDNFANWLDHLSLCFQELDQVIPTEDRLAEELETVFGFHTDHRTMFRRHVGEVE